MTGIVVVGAGIAGVRTVQGLLKRGHEGPIIVIGAEPHAPYDRPPLSKAVLRGEVPLPALIPATAEPAPNVEWRTGVTALGLRPEAHQLETDAGVIDYDALVIATGAHARRVPDLPGEVLRTWDDALRLRTALQPGAVVAIVGAGLIGCEVAASARGLGAEVHLIDVLDAPMTRVVGPKVAHEISELHRRHAVNLHLSTSVAAGPDATITFGDGTSLRPDVVLHAIGAAPNTAWLAESGLDVSNGVRCDEDGRTEAPDVYAVGDVAAWGGSRSEHWSSATEQAGAVAATLLGEPPAVRPVPYWWSDQYDVKFQGLGDIAEADDVKVGPWGPEGRLVALYGRAGTLVGVVGFSAPKTVMGLRIDILNATPFADVLERLEDIAT